MMHVLNGANIVKEVRITRLYTYPESHVGFDFSKRVANKLRYFAPWEGWVSCLDDAGLSRGMQLEPESREPWKRRGRCSTPALPWHEERPLLDPQRKTW